MAVFGNANFGDLILRAAGSIVSQQQKAQQLKLQQDQFAQQVKQQNSLAAAKAGQLQAEQAQMKAEQETFAAAGFPGGPTQAKAEGAFADIQRTKALTAQTGQKQEGQITANKKQDMFSVARDQVVAQDLNNSLSSFMTEEAGSKAKLPVFTSFPDMQRYEQKLRARVSDQQSARGMARTEEGRQQIENLKALGAWREANRDTVQSLAEGVVSPTSVHAILAQQRGKEVADDVVGTHLSPQSDTAADADLGLQGMALAPADFDTAFSNLKTAPAQLENVLRSTMAGAGSAEERLKRGQRLYQSLITRGMDPAEANALLNKARPR